MKKNHPLVQTVFFKKKTASEKIYQNIIFRFFPLDIKSEIGRTASYYKTYKTYRIRHEVFDIVKFFHMHVYYGDVGLYAYIGSSRLLAYLVRCLGVFKISLGPVL